jgi:23S rRNA pseudouridine2605 synthase/16S rRNA pseudouridine516 synthase
VPRPEPTGRVVAFHKARGLVTTHADELGRETVYDRLRAVLPPHLARVRWHAIGRLDADTTGLLLFTDDGALLSHVTQPATKVPKTYAVLARGLLGEDTAAALRTGVELSGGLGRSAPCEVAVTGFGVATTHLEVTLTEGKNRQVRRMLLAIGSQVIRLARLAVGGVRLADLPEDGWRLLGATEVAEGLGYRPSPSLTLRQGIARRPPRKRS